MNHYEFLGSAFSNISLNCKKGRYVGLKINKFYMARDAICRVFFSHLVILKKLEPRVDLADLPMKTALNL